jgi:hypothetical protein
VICAKDDIKAIATTNHIAMATLNNSFVVTCCQGWMSFYLLCINFPFEMDFSICTNKKRWKTTLKTFWKSNNYIFPIRNISYIMQCLLQAYNHVHIYWPKAIFKNPNHHELDCNPNHPKNYMMYQWNDLST